MKEIWKDIDGYEGLYQISNLGRVKSLPRERKTRSCYITKEKILKQTKNRNGYWGITLHKDYKLKTIAVHILVAKAFVDNPNNYPIVNHKDENPSNPKVDNLEWCTVAYNNTYGSAIEKRRKNTNYIEKAKKIMKKVNQYTLEGELIKTWDSVKEAAMHYKVCPSNITKVCSKDYKQSCGFLWKLAKEGD